ncbi:MFS transporter [Marmoricola endophyticus]|uniref:MFS transporter n=1 Tax=Marmoricola endophyticus TaxID=2040280 RepID=A0A917BIB4_9ACTN|nr:MFS transporter [Marmoricola endophyticus]GGF42582.1 MFS transporter [Marmoricola endophyticus]
MSPLSSYRRLLALAGPAYVLVAFLGRLPLAMSQLGTLLLVSTATGSYGAGGAAAGSLAVANAVGSPVAAAVADRRGQRPVVLVQSLLGAVGLVVLVHLAASGVGEAGLVAVAAVTGLALPQVGPLARVRWRPITAGDGHQRRLVDAAFSYEGAADEASFVLGPALVGVVAVAVSPSGALVIAAAVLAVFGCAFGLHRTAALTGASAAGGAVVRRSGRLVTGAFVVLLLAQAAIGVLFGSSQTGATVLTTAAGQPGLAGLVHATLGIGSVTAGLATAFLPERVPHERRWLVAAVALAVLSVPLLLVDTVASAFLAVLLLGFAVAPYMIAVFTLGERIVPPARVGAALTLLAAATGVGYALGSSLAGRLSDSHGHTAAFAVTVTTTCLAALLALTQHRRVIRARLAVADDVDAPAVAAA